MDKLEEMLTQAESQEESNEQWEHLDRYETKEYYTDEHGYTRINNKSIEDVSENISVSGENNSQYIEFRMNRFYDGVDLSEMVISVFYEAEGVGDEGYVINAYRNSEELKFGWIIPSSVTQYREIQLCVWVRGILEDGSDYILKTLPKVYTIYPGLNIGGTIPEPEENWYLNFVRVMDSKVSEASSYASVAKSSAEEAKSLEDSYKEMNENVSTKSSQVDEQYSQIQIMHSESLEAAAQAEQYRDEAKAFRDEAESIANIGIATTEKAGLVKPDGETITVDEDGTIHANGSQGTIDYEELENKPQINGNELSGNKTLSELGIASADDLQKVENKIDTIIEKAELNIKNTASGKNIHLTDSANSKVVEFGLHGKAEQKQYSGKNLLQITTTSQTVKGVTFTVDNGCITVNGTATETFFIEIGRANALEAGNYTISGCPNGGSETTFNFEAVSVKAGSNDWVTRYIEYGNEAQGRINGTDSQAFIANIRIRSGVTVNNLVFKPMIRLASITDSTYEPYVGGIASPNPDYPQEITVSGSDGSVEVVSCRKNLLKNTAESTTTNGVTFTVNKDGSVSCTGQPTAWTNFKTNNSFILKKGTYKFSSGANFYNPYIRIMRWSDSKDLYNSRKGDIQTIVVEEECECFAQISASNGYAFTQSTIYPMIRLASDTDDTFEAYTETLSTIPIPNGLAGIKVSSGGNYTDENGQQWICDEVVKYADGSGKRIQRINKVVVDENTGIVKHDLSNKDYFVCYLRETGLNKTKFCLSSHFSRPFDNSANLGVTSCLYMGMNLSPLHISVPTSIASDVESFRTWAIENGFVVYYELAEPIITDLSAEEIAEIEKLYTFYPITNIANDAECGMSVTYLCDAKNYIDNRLALLETALVNSI